MTTKNVVEFSSDTVYNIEEQQEQINEKSAIKFTDI
jgi:hypothetical protein